MIENHISGNLYNELFSESSEEKMYGISKYGLVPIVHKYTIKNCSSVSQAFFSRSLCILYFLFHKNQGTSAIRQSRICFPIFFCFHECCNNFY